MRCGSRILARASHWQCLDSAGAGKKLNRLSAAILVTQLVYPQRHDWNVDWTERHERQGHDDEIEHVPVGTAHTW